MSRRMFHPAGAAGLGVLVWLLLIAPSQAEFAGNASSPASEGNLISSGPGGFNGINISTYLGANAFYSVGITGQNAIVGNVEAGHIWNGHETLNHVSSYSHHIGTFGTTTAELFDRHATWVGQAIAGRGALAYQRGIAYGAELRSGAIATRWNGDSYSLNFGLSSDTFMHAYRAMFGQVGVVNSSYGYADSPGTSFFTAAIDALAYQNPRTLMVASAGNSGPNGNTVGAPGTGYNVLTVGALSLNGAATAYDSVAGFSSRAPSHWQGSGGTVYANVRATVDLVAPGTALTLAYYGGQTGGNNPLLAGSTAGPAGGDRYTANLAGTSFSSPIVAGAATLLHSYANTHTAFAAGGQSEATDARVVKAVLMNSADKIAGWSNNQFLSGGIITTQQSLDYNSGAGALNIGRAYAQFVEGTTGVAGTTANVTARVGTSGWDLGGVQAAEGSFDSVYLFDHDLLGGSMFTATLTWFRDRIVHADNSTTDQRQAILDLIFFRTDEFGTLLESNIVARSISDFNVVEHLHLEVPQTGLYGLAVDYYGNLFNAAGLSSPIVYGLAWSGAPAPEPGTLLLLAGPMLMLRRHSRGGRGWKIGA